MGNLSNKWFVICLSVMLVIGLIMEPRIFKKKNGERGCIKDYGSLRVIMIAIIGGLVSLTIFSYLKI